MTADHLGAVLAPPEAHGALDVQVVNGWTIRTFEDPEYAERFCVRCVNGGRVMHRRMLTAHEAATFDPARPAGKAG